MARTRLTLPMRAAWARVSIHLDLGDLESATAAARQASELTGDWSRFGRYIRTGRLLVYATTDVPGGWAWVEQRQMLISASVREEFANSALLARFSDARHPPNSFQPYEVEDWRLWERINRHRLGLDWDLSLLEGLPPGPTELI